MKATVENLGEKRVDLWKTTKATLGYVVSILFKMKIGKEGGSRVIANRFIGNSVVLRSNVAFCSVQSATTKSVK